MKFYNRESELSLLKKIKEASNKSSKMTIIVGRRRIGKTRLITEFCSTNNYIYLFVTKKNEPLLCKEFIDEIKSKININIFGNITKFKDVFEILSDYTKKNPLTLIIDEFQEFEKINPSIYSDMQNIWDKNRNSGKMNLIVCGSIYTLMKKIFENSKEPLFGRADEKIHLKPFNVKVLKNILKDNYNKYSNNDLLSFYIITGGVAKYVELLCEKKAFTFNKIINEIFKENSLFIEEGKNILVEEFGKDYSTYFSILSLIADSKTSRVEIESILEKNVGGYIDNLEKEYNIIKKIKPIFAKPESRSQKYFIEDNFLNFWFRFIYKFRSTIEIGNYDYIKNIVKRDFAQYSGKFLEKFLIEKLSLTKKYSIIGNYWDKKSENEIDIIAINESERKALFVDVKLNRDKINIAKLKAKANNLPFNLSNYKIKFEGLSIDDL